jgi:hypothetical protein
MNWTWSITTICGTDAQSKARFNLASEGYRQGGFEQNWIERQPSDRNFRDLSR